jgi:hypothetical protein
MKIAVKKMSNGSGKGGSVCGNNLISGREIGTGDMVFVRILGFGRGRSDYDSMGTLSRHIGYTGK